ncbi:MAG: hypothetical protein RSD26_09475 [Cellulosilyticaceae bacterium]
MRKIGFIIGSIEIILGLISLIITSLIQQVIPKIARMCFIFNNGSFGESDYIINVGFSNAISVCLCLVGVVTIIYFIISKKDI